MKHIWIARDIDHWLRIGTSKPVKDKYKNGYWAFGTSHLKDILDYDLYPELTYENSPKELLI